MQLLHHKDSLKFRQVLQESKGFGLQPDGNNRTVEPETERKNTGLHFDGSLPVPAGKPLGG